MPNYKPHPVADIFPLMEGEPFDSLVEDIKANGLLDPIELLDNKIIDGRNRYSACKKAGVEPRFKDAEFSGSPVAYAMSKNLHRRHLDESQRGMAGARALPLFEAEAKERQKEHGGTAPGKKKTLSAARPQVKKGTGKAASHAAKAVNASGRSVVRATKILKTASEEVVQAIEKGDLKLFTAESLVTLPKAAQRKAIKGGKKAVSKAVKKAKKAPPKTRINNTEVAREELIGNALKSLDTIIREIKKRGKLSEKIRGSATRKLQSAKEFVKESKIVL